MYNFNCYSVYGNSNFYDVTIKSCEQRLITKEHIAMYTILILLLKLALYILQYYYSDKKLCFKPKFLLKHYKPVFFYKLHYLYYMPTFKVEALCIVGYVQLVKCILL